MIKNTILIVGGAGYIGSHANKELNKRGYKTVVFDNLSKGHREFVKWGDFFKGDLANKKKLEACFKKYPIKAVMHFGAFAYVGESVDDPAKYYINNVTNTLNLLEVMRKHNVKHFIFSSTAATFGEPLKIPINEKHSQIPINPYGRTKKIIEDILKDYSHAYGLKYIALRYFNAAGCDPDSEIGELHKPETHLIPLILDAAIGRRKDIKIFGTDYKTPDGSCVRDYIHVSDLADAHIKALEYLFKGGKSDSFNLGNGKGFSVKEVIEVAKKITGRKIRIIETKRRAGDPAVLIASSLKAKKLLGWKPQFNRLSAIMETAWNWHNGVRELNSPAVNRKIKVQRSMGKQKIKKPRDNRLTRSRNGHGC